MPAAAQRPTTGRRIAINAHLLAQDPAGGYRRAGVSRYIENLLRYLAVEDPEANYTVFAGGRNALVSSLRLRTGWGWTERHSRLPTRNSWARIFWEQCLQPLELQHLGIELLHSPVNIQPLVLPCRGVVTVMDLSFMLFPSAFRTLQSSYQRVFTRLSVRRASRLLTISAHTARDLVRLFGVPPERVSVTYPGVDAAFRPLSDSAVAEFRRRRGLPEAFFLYVGTLEPRKNLSTLIHAYASFKRSASAVRKLVLAGGKGWLYESLFAEVKELGVQQDVIFPGYVPEDELPYWYNAAEVFVYPSLYEGFGLPPLEAMACGTPVVVSNASSLPEVVGNAGHLVPPDSAEAWAAALAQMAGDADLRMALAQRGQARAREFTWTRTVRQTMQAYQSSLAGGA